MSGLPLKPGATLGVLGGGQLARMWSHAAQSLGYRTAVLDPDPHSPAGLISHEHIQTGYLDPQGLAQMASLCAAVSTEFENVPAEALAQLQQHMPVAPGPSAVRVAQDRALEKAHFVRCGVPVAPHRVIHDASELAQVQDDLLPGILKTTRLGYDGKGQARVNNRAELAAAFTQLQNADPSVVCILEKRLPLAAECSVVLARGVDGHTVHLPLQTNLHRDGILAVTEVFDAALPAATESLAIQSAYDIARQLDYTGVLCVEFFLLQDGPVRDALGPLVVNEIAPRPHNSGHHSINSCDVSQFELQVRCMAGLPLTMPRLHSPCVMLNLLGDLWLPHGDSPLEPDWAAVLALPGAHLHLYGKTEARRGRKMGHLTLTASAIEQARQTALKAAGILGIAPW
ncbi:MAG: 5-(carboxyamino)imidazole ribonucleotide synthase [Burkholderiales bacterium]|nr:5-(carboxyamino)imidazole ribonucleotide synthase [Burkholderiales bacterium]